MPRLPLWLLLGTAIAGVVGVAAWLSPAPWTLMMDTGTGFVGQTVPAYRVWAGAFRNGPISSGAGSP